MLRDVVQKPPNPVTKARAARDLVVSHMAARIVEAIAGRLAAQIMPQENILEPCTLDHRPQGCGIEMWGETRVGV